MGFDEGQIVLNSDTGSFFPGQILSGRLEFDQEKPKKFRGIYAEIKGTCKVHWTTSHTRRVNDREERYTVTHESYEEYMNLTIYLVGSKSGEMTIQPGRHVFPFECQIPPNCPSSFEGSNGSVRYKVKVTVDRAFKIDQTKQMAFRVMAPLNLNDIPNCKDPLEIEFEQTFCCWCTKSGIAETLIKLPARGWCPRQIIPIEMACTNNSTVELDIIKFSIIKTISFEAVHEPDYRSEEETIASLKKGPIPANTTRNYTVEMEVPHMDVPNLNNCRFISMSFRFRVDISTSGCHTDEDQTFDIFIGTIPLNASQFVTNGMETVQNTQGVNSFQTPIVTQPGYPGQYPGAPNLGFNQNYPNTSPYPPNASPYPPNTTPYPVPPNVTPYPVPPNVTPYPAPPNVTPYPVSPNVTPYPGHVGQNPPVTSQNLVTSAPNPPNSSPYPANAPYNPGANQPYPAPNVPYPQSNVPYPPSNVPYPPSNVPYPGETVPLNGLALKTGDMGFNSSNPTSEAMPLLPPNALPRAASPFSTATAPASSPVEEKKEDKVIPPYPQ